MAAPLRAPLEPSPSFGELSMDELHHRFKKGILSPEELLSDSIGNLLAVVPFGGLTRQDGLSRDNQAWKQSTVMASGLWGTTFARTAATNSAPELVQRAEELGSVCIGLSVDETARNPLFPDHVMEAPWGGGAGALLGWAVQFTLGLDERGNLARTVLATGLPGFRLRSPSPGHPAPGWLHNYWVDAPILVGSFLEEALAVGTSRFRIDISPELKSWLGPILQGFLLELRNDASETESIRILPLNDATLLAAETLNCAAAYVPWRHGSSDSAFFQILAPHGAEMQTASIARLLAGPAAAYS